jgi:hypothetical protein
LFKLPFHTIILDNRQYNVSNLQEEQEHTYLTEGANMSPWVLAHALECTPELLALGPILAWIRIT